MTTPMKPTVETSSGFSFWEAPQLSDGLPVLALSGSIDADAAELLNEELQRRLRQGQNRFALDFSSVGFLGSSGLGTLIASIAEARDEGGDLVLCGFTAELRHVLELLDLLNYVTLIN